MRRFKTHICLVGQNEELNIPPSLHPGFKPDKILLIFSSWHKEKSRNLSLIFNHHQIQTQFIEITDKREPKTIVQRIEELIIEQLKQSPDDKNALALNITSGSQLLSLICHELFEKYQLPVFYVNKETDVLHFLPLISGHSYQFHLDDRLKIFDYLLAYGIKAIPPSIPNRETSKAHITLCQTLIEGIEQYQKPLGKFNYYAARTDKSFQVTIKHSDLKDHEFVSMIYLFSHLKIIDFNGSQLNFKNETERFFCNGGWLEEYVFLELTALKQQLLIQDIYIGLEIELPGGSKNELDICFMANNRFYLIECKTKKYSGHTAGNNTLYKLDTLKHYGSTQSKAMLISYHKLTNSNRRRASDYQLSIISAHKLKQLKKHIVQWVEEA
ncbi:Card1-like endonuclease domain-containing protein [sulfur-oxidizing endosymbiont of Gigantopelta aegis]|uniref:Card1-like endonuclease domain-containing protein n=1 Tax=sulfur-oxidizing endosymbiont of Gigantopelta aegis TaxID=2794934 RepID=UPI001FE40725|nr:DUF1887 family CARF protein [sulfur-oxidizing endosymbiont of Gigantopelta aegis]